MAEFSMGWPSSDEQKLIADFMEQADREQALEEIDLQKLQQLKAGLMDDLLTGRIRVTPLLAQ